MSKRRTAVRSVLLYSFAIALVSRANFIGVPGLPYAIAPFGRTPA